MLISQPWPDPELSHFVRTAAQAAPSGRICPCFFTICEQQVRYSISQPLQHQEIVTKAAYRLPGWFAQC